MRHISRNEINKEDYLFFMSDVGYYFALDKRWLKANNEDFSITLPTDEVYSRSELEAFFYKDVDVNYFQFFETAKGFKGGVDASFIMQVENVVEIRLPNGEVYNDVIAEGFECTDPSCHQYVKILSDGKFHFMEFGRDGSDLHESTIDMSKYSTKDILRELASYYPQDEIKGFIEEDNSLVIAECIHENQIY